MNVDQLVFMTTNVIFITMLIFAEIMIGSGAYKDNVEFTVYVNIINAIVGIYVSRPKSKSSKSLTNYASKTAILNFVVVTVVYLNIFIFAIIMLAFSLYKNEHHFAIYTGFLTTIIGIYVSKPKYKNKNE